MRRRLEPAVRRWWEGEAGPVGSILSGLLLPAELAYRAVVRARNAAYDRGWVQMHEVGVPVVSVGNVLVGGAGKTPVSAWIARALADAGRAPAVVCRGYGADEPRLHAAWNPDVPVYAETDRVAAVGRAVDDGRRSVVLDDGFQHRRLARDVDLVLVPVEVGFQGRLLPRGPFREPPTALRRAHRIVLTRRTAKAERALTLESRIREAVPGVPVSRLHLAPSGWTSLQEGDDASPPDGPVLAVTGIARPRAFSELVGRITGAPVELVTFPDHHDFSEADLQEIRRRAAGRVVVTTEKDAVRVSDPEALGNHVRVLRLRVVEEGGRDLSEGVRAVVEGMEGRDEAARSAGADAGGPPSSGRPETEPGARDR